MPLPDSPRRRYHFHLPGVIYIGVAVFLSIGALNSQNNLLFAALGLAIGGLLISGVVSGMSLMGIRVERVQARDTAVGQPLNIVYTIRNTSRFMPAFGLTICEVGGGSPEGTWRRFLRIPPQCHIAHIGPGQMLHAEAVAWPGVRGRITLNAIQVWSTFPFGIARKSVTFFQLQSVVVRPLVVPLRPGAADNQRKKVERGLSAGRFAGAGDEFFALREYVPGDLPRHIAWRATARTGQLLVAQRAAPVPTRAWVVLRLSGDPGANERAIALAASLVRQTVDDGVAVGLAVPGTGVLRPPDANRWHVERLMNELAMLEAPAAGPVEFPAAAARSGACLVVWSGPVDASFGPRGARHFSSDYPERLAADPPSAAAIKNLRPPMTPAAPAVRAVSALREWFRLPARRHAEGHL